MNRRSFLLTMTMIGSGLAIAPESMLTQTATPTSAGPLDAKLMEDLIAANRILYRQGVNDAFGHISVRHNGNPQRYVLARSLAPNLVTPDDLIEYDLDSNPVNLRGREQYSERFIHGEIYKARPDVQSVAHSHTAEVIPFTITTQPFRPVFHVASFLGAGIPIFDIRTQFGMTNMLINDSARGRALATSLGKNTALLMRGHGAVVVGPSIPHAVGRSIYLVFNAKALKDAIEIGGQINYIDPQEAQAYIDGGESRNYERPWEMWKLEVAR
jgi:HCOMODA/2-hydroxy-3-carboxy-muconic semialdehyde decarboxylase